MNFRNMALALLLSSCSQPQDTIFVPQEVYKPVIIPCKVPDVSRPPDLLSALPMTASLTSGMKACLAQHDYAIGYEHELEAALKSCE